MTGLVRLCVLAVFMLSGTAFAAEPEAEQPPADAASVTDEATTYRADRRGLGRSHVQQRRLEYRLRKSGDTQLRVRSTPFVYPGRGTFAWNAADPPRFEPRAPTHREFQWRGRTVQNRRLFNPH